MSPESYGVGWVAGTEDSKLLLLGIRVSGPGVAEGNAVLSAL